MNSLVKMCLTLDLDLDWQEIIWAFKTAQKEDSMFIDLDEFKEVMFNISQMKQPDQTLEQFEDFLLRL